MNQEASTATATSAMVQDQPLPLTVYGELSILGYNGYIPNVERNGRKNKSKFLLCKRPDPNGIKKTRHYIVKQPQATKAMQDKDLHSISFTFSRSQTIIVEYGRDEGTDMFQIGRSSESPIDFVVMDTITPSIESVHSSNSHQQNHSHSSRQLLHNSRNENATSSGHHHNNQHAQPAHGENELARINRFHRHLAKVGEELIHYAGPQPGELVPPPAHDQRNRIAQSHHRHHHHPSHQVLLNYPQHNNSNLPPMMVEHLRAQEYFHRHDPHSDPHNHAGVGGPSHAFYAQAAISQLLPSIRSNNIPSSANNSANHDTRNLGDQSGSGVNNSRHNNMSCKRTHATQSTISRFACRILVDRKPPYTARIYAAGFDSSKNIFLGEKATKWEQDNTIDGLTTNGVLLMHQKTEQGTGGVWREVSVDGGIYAIRASRSAAQKGVRIEDESNVLQDGTLIDLCGATLLWRSVDGFKAAPTKKALEEKIDLLNATRPQCPVGLNTLVIPRKPILPNSHHHHRSHQPYVYLKCGHVQGYHDWGATEKSNQRTCPICLSVGTVARLSMGLEPSFYVDSGPITHVLNPCGHMASEKTVNYWCNVKIPHGTHFFHSICPFCATPLASNNNEPTSTRLIFQDELD